MVLSMAIVASAAAMKVTFNGPSSNVKDFQDFAATAFDMPNPADFTPESFPLKENLGNLPGSDSKATSGYKDHLAEIDKQALEQALIEASLQKIEDTPQTSSIDTPITVNEMMAAIDHIKAQVDEPCELTKKTLTEPAKVTCDYPGAKEGASLTPNTDIFLMGIHQGLKVYAVNNIGYGIGILPDGEESAIFIEPKFIKEIIASGASNEELEQIVQFNLKRAVVMADLLKDGKDAMSNSEFMDGADSIVARGMFEEGAYGSEIASIMKKNNATQLNFLSASWNINEVDKKELANQFKKRESFINEIIANRESVSEDVNIKNYEANISDTANETFIEPTYLNLETGSTEEPETESYHYREVSSARN